jgi:hypothetical protein
MVFLCTVFLLVLAFITTAMCSLKAFTALIHFLNMF